MYELYVLNWTFLEFPSFWWDRLLSHVSINNLSSSLASPQSWFAILSVCLIISGIKISSDMLSSGYLVAGLNDRLAFSIVTTLYLSEMYRWFCVTNKHNLSFKNWKHWLNIWSWTLTSRERRQSSRRYMSLFRYRALAKLTLAFCPLLRLQPLSPTIVWSPELNQEKCYENTMT